jgi:ABC-2 type transport system ATP-binding protein
VNEPELVFLDEPTTGLDAQSRRELHGEVARMKREGRTVLLTTHDISEAEALCDRIAILDHGRIIATGTPSDLIARSSATFSVFLGTAQPVDGELLASLAGVQDLVCEGGSVRFRTADVNRTLAALVKLLEARECTLVELHVRKATLEDVFIELTGTELRD